MEISEEHFNALNGNLPALVATFKGLTFPGVARLPYFCSLLHTDKQNSQRKIRDGYHLLMVWLFGQSD
jgi:hypothetical protein